MIEAMQLRKTSDRGTSSTIQPMQLQKSMNESVISGQASGRRHERHEYYNRTFEQDAEEESQYATKRTTRRQLGKRQKKSQSSRIVWAMVCVIFVVVSGSTWIKFSGQAQFSDIHNDNAPMITTRSDAAVTETTAEKTDQVNTVSEEKETTSESDSTDISKDFPYEYVEINRDYSRN